MKRVPPLLIHFQGTPHGLFFMKELYSRIQPFELPQIIPCNETVATWPREARLWLKIAANCIRRDLIGPACWLFAASKKPENALPLLWFRLRTKVVYHAGKYWSEDGQLIGPRPFWPRGSCIQDILEPEAKNLAHRFGVSLSSLVASYLGHDTSGLYVLLSKHLDSYKNRRLTEIDSVRPFFVKESSSFSFRNFELGKRIVKTINGKKVDSLSSFVRDFYMSLRNQQHEEDIRCQQPG